jgi:uncharacterized protein (UPF0210 family)
MRDDVTAIIKRITRVGEIIEKQVKEEVQNSFLQQELVMRAAEIQQLAASLIKTQGDTH